MTFDQQRFAGNRYERLAQAASVLADDPAVVDAPFPFDGSGLRAFVAGIVEQRLLDGLSGRDADLVSMVLLLYFPFVPRCAAWELPGDIDQESESRRGQGGRFDDETAVAAALNAALDVANAAIPVPTAR
jgi:hypothetical protein